MPQNYFLTPQRNNVNHFNYYYYTKAFTESEMEQIEEIASKIPKIPGETGASEDGKVSDYRISDIAWIMQMPNTEWLYKKMADYAIEANQQMWNFDIWGYQDNFQYTIYYGDGGGHYDWHADLGPGMSNRKLSCVLQLSEPTEYEGGELQMNIGGSVMSVPKEKGLLCFFPSFILHRVTPLTSGTRKSLVTWLCGANLR
jgi:PKHD-type hydroxylase